MYPWRRMLRRYAGKVIHVSLQEAVEPFASVAFCFFRLMLSIGHNLAALNGGGRDCTICRLQIRPIMRSMTTTVSALTFLDVLSPDAELPQMIKQPVEVRKPQNQNDDDHAIQDRFDLSLHWDEPVHKPQQKPDCDDCDDDGGKWHIMFSDQYLVLDPRSGQRRDVMRAGVELPSCFWHDFPWQLHTREEHMQLST
jgi:hypothetical protein